MTSRSADFAGRILDIVSIFHDRKMAVVYHSIHVNTFETAHLWRLIVQPRVKYVGQNVVAYAVSFLIYIRNPDFYAPTELYSCNYFHVAKK